MSSLNQESTTQNEEILIKDELTISETRVESELFHTKSDQSEVNQEHYQFLNINQDNNEPYIIVSEDEDSEMPSSILPDLHPPEYSRPVQVNPNEINTINSNESTAKCVIQVDRNKINQTNSNKSNVNCVYELFPLNAPLKLNGLRTNIVKKLKNQKGQPILYINKQNYRIVPSTHSQLTHSSPERYKCGLCNLTFDKAIDRNNHIVSHSIAPTYKCKCCRNDFPYFTALLNHLQVDICYKEFPVNCFHCMHTSTTVDRLLSHHQLEMKKCKWCGLKICGREIHDAHLPLCRFRRGKLKKPEPEVIDLTANTENFKRFKRGK